MHMSPIPAIAFLVGVNKGGTSGGAIPAILLNSPGTPEAAASALDGYPMAKRGEAGNALRISAYASAVGGVASGLSLLLLAPPLATVTLLFGPAEYFWVALFGMCSIAILLGADPLKGLISSTIGLLIGTIGIDSVSGHERFTLDIYYLTGGFNFIVLLAGLYGLPPAIELAQTAARQKFDAARIGLGTGENRFRDWRSLTPTLARSSLIGIVIGILPGVGGTMAAFLSYNEAKRADNDPDSFGKGNPQGIAAAESANNAVCGGALVPMLTFGIPGDPITAIVLGVLVINGIQPGPQLMESQAGLIAPMLAATPLIEWALSRAKS